jgi:hypothetical protein
MSVVQIPNLGSAVALNGTEQLEGVQAGTSVKLTVAQIGSYITAQYPPPGVSSIATSAPITGGTITTAGTVGLAAAGVTNTYLAAMAGRTVKANTTANPAEPSDVSVSALLDTIGDDRGSVLYRGASSWNALAPGTAGYVLKTDGASTDPYWATSGTPSFGNIYPNYIFAGDPVSGNTGGGGEPPEFRLMSATDLPQLERDGSRRYSRWLTDVALDHGRSFEWYRNQGSPYDDTVAFIRALKEETVLVIDRGTIYLSDTIGQENELTNCNVVSLLGDEPVTFVMLSDTRPIFDFASQKNCRFWGKFRIVYPTPAVSTCKSIHINTANNIYFEDLTITNAGIGLYHTAGDNIRFGKLHIENPTGVGMTLLNGANLKIDNELKITGGAAVGLSIPSTWDGGLMANRVIITGCQEEGMTYASAGVLDQITDLRVSNNGLSASGTKAGVSITAAARNLKVLGGEIGQDAAGSGVTQLYGVRVAAGADRIAIGASLIGNTTPYLNSSTGNVVLSGLMPAGVSTVAYTPVIAFTPGINFATPGDVVWSAVTATGNYIKIGQMVWLDINITATPTFTTATGNLEITHPFTALGTSGMTSALACSLTNANVNWGVQTDIYGRIATGTNIIRLGTGRSAGSAGLIVATTNIASGTSISFHLNGTIAVTA